MPKKDAKDNGKYISKELDKLRKELNLLNDALENASLEEAASIQRNIVAVNDRIVKILNKGSPIEKTKANTFRTELEEGRKYKSQLIDLEKKRREVITQLSTALSIEKLKECSLNLGQWVDEAKDILDKLKAKYPDNETAISAENSKSALKRQLREDYKKIIKCFLLKVCKEQIENRVWRKGTPKDILAKMKLTADEEERFTEFKDPVTKEYVEYAVLVTTLSNDTPRCFDVDTWGNISKHTQHAELTDKEQYDAIRLPTALQTLLPAESISICHPISHEELTVDNFFEISDDLPKKFYNILKDIKKQREEAQTSIENKRNYSDFRRRR